MADNKSNTSTDVPPSTSKDKHVQEPTQATMRVHLTETSWRVATPLLFFSLGGNWLDTQFGTKPLIVIIGLLLGTTVSFVSVKTYVAKAFPESEQK